MTETLSHTIVEYLLPETVFAIGDIDKETLTPHDLRSYQGMSLQFANRHRMYFSADRVGELLYPTPSDRVAYGSLPFTANVSFSEISAARVLAIDHSTGNNGGLLPIELARRLVSDCYGKMSFDLAERLTNATNLPFQFRLGLKPQPGNPAYRIAKGTLAPDPRLGNTDIGLLDWTQSWATERWLKSENPKERQLLGAYFSGTRRENIREVLSHYDLVLPTSSFKGRRGEDAIAPGEYVLTVGIGVKAKASYLAHSLGDQVLVNFPNAVEQEINPILEKMRLELVSAQKSPHDLARYYCRAYEERQHRDEAYDEEELEIFEAIDNAFGDSARADNYLQTIYQLLETDLAHHGQIVEMEFFADELRKCVVNKWRDLATGRAITFNSGLAQPCLDLGENEVCVPGIPDGEEVIVTRSPLVNANGVIVLTNRHLAPLMRLHGTVHIHPNTAAECFQADFDGDRFAFEQASCYPTLAAEIQAHHAAERRYPSVIKLEKIDYTGTIEEIAASAVDLNIGSFANQVKKYVVLRTEVARVPPTERQCYFARLGEHFRGLLESGEGNLPIPESLQSRMKEATPTGEFYRRAVGEVRGIAAKLAALPLRPTTQAIESATQAIDRLMYLNISLLQNDFQVQVDGPKSARRADPSLYAFCQSLADYKDIIAIQGKKKPDLYLTKPFASNDYSALGMMVEATNNKWNAVTIKARPSEQFQRLFDEPTPFMRKEAERIRLEYNAFFNQAGKLRELRAKHPEVANDYAIATSQATGHQVYLTKINPAVLSAIGNDRILMKLVSHPESPHLLVATVKAQNGASLVIGNVAPSSVAALNLKSGHVATVSVTHLLPGVKQSHIKALYQQAESYKKALYEQYPTAQARQDIAGALWWTSFSRRTLHEHRYNKGVSAMLLFPDTVSERLESLQFQQLRTLVKAPALPFQGYYWDNERVPIEIGTESIAGKQFRTLSAYGLLLGTLDDQRSQLPLGTRAEATLSCDVGATVTAVTPRGNEITIRNVRYFDYNQTQWQGEQVKLTVFKTRDTKNDEINSYAIVDNKILGTVDKKALEKLRAAGANLDARPATFQAILHSSVMHLHVTVDSHTVTYPWKEDQQELRSLVRETETLHQRALYRIVYQEMVEAIQKQRATDNLPMGTIDLQIARIVMEKTNSEREVMLVLSQSNAVRKRRESLPDVESLHYENEYCTYRQDALRYAKDIIDRSVGNERTKGFERS